MPSLKIEEITPMKAAKLLSLNTHNRDLTANRVKNLAGAIKRGEWRLNSDCIAFSGNGDGGVLLNGQHRLHAVIQAETAITVGVMYGLEPEAQETMDSGASRSLGAKLKLRGESSYHDLAAALNLAWRYDQSGVMNPDGKSWTIPTHQQLFDYLDQWPMIREAVPASKPARKEFGSPAGNWAAFVFLFSREVDSERSEVFFQTLVTGADLAEKNPILVLRNVLLRQAKLPTDRRSGYQRIAALTVKSFNSWCLDQETGKLMWRSVGPKAEPFPRIITLAELNE